MKALNPTPQLLSKIGSIIVHAEEMLGPYGTDVDRLALLPLLKDADVQEWISDMGTLLPLQRGSQKPADAGE